MADQESLDRAYMECAFAMAKLSHATRRKVGAILVSPKTGIIAEGVNGKPSGFPNHCENVYESHRIERSIDTNNQPTHYECVRCQQKWPLIERERLESGDYIGDCCVTQEDVLHAESNAIAKVARSTNSSAGATLYITLSPCFDCAKLIIQTGIVRVVYAEEYRKMEGLDLLFKAKIQVDNLSFLCYHVGDDELNIQDEGLYHDDGEPWRGKSHP